MGEWVRVIGDKRAWELVLAWAKVGRRQDELLLRPSEERKWTLSTAPSLRPSDLCTASPFPRSAAAAETVHLPRSPATLPHVRRRYADYANSKLCNTLFTAELSRRLTARGSSVTAYSVSPGRVATGIFRNVPGVLRRPLELLARAFFQTPEQGARTVLRAALAPELQRRHVLYMHAGEEAEPAAAARNAALAGALWTRSAAAVGLHPEEDAALWPPA